MPTRRHFLKTGSLGAVALGGLHVPVGLVWGREERSFPPPETEGGWEVEEPAALGVDAARLVEAVAYHDQHSATTSYGGALVVVHRGRILAESYVTGSDGGPRSWTARTCNDVKSSTKSVFGTAVGVFLEEHGDRVGLDTLLVGGSREESLVPQIWEQPLTDERKKRIRVEHVLSMTSGHASREPWLAPTTRHHFPGYSGPFQMYEYCFGWWRFEGIPAHDTLLFHPGTEFNYSNYGLEQLALAMRNVTGEQVGPYLYDRVLGHIGMPLGIRNNQFRDMPYETDKELNFAGEPGWGVGGSGGCDAYGADKSESPLGYNSIAGSTFRCNARDFARLGYLWLNVGRWRDRQLVPEAWIRRATRRYLRGDGSAPVNYGFTFWMQDDWDGVPSDTFASRGHNLNDCYVVPSLDLVVARQGNDNPPRAERETFTRTLLSRVVSALQ